MGYQACLAPDFALCYGGGFRRMVSDWIRHAFDGPPSTRPWHGIRVGFGGAVYAGFTYTFADGDIFHGKITGLPEP